MSLYSKLKKKIEDWITYEPPADEVMPYNFDRLKHEIKRGDVLIIEGRSLMSRVIRTLTQSPWTHAALYIGRLIDIEDEELQTLIKQHTSAKDNTRLIIEDLLDQGTTISLLSTYKQHHIRICRPIGITPQDLDQVISFAVKSLGQPYNVRHLLDLARFLLPWTLLPRRWGSSLFRTANGQPESGICSSLIANAFLSVQFPVLPYINSKEEQMQLYQRNPYLFTPKDFDYSPYFEIIKYPLFNPDEPLPYYRRLPWSTSGKMHQDYGILSAPEQVKPKKNIFRRFRRHHDDKK